MKTAPKHSKGGFTLIETLVAIVILGLASVGLAGMLMKGTQLTRDSGAMAYRSAVLAAEVSRVTSTPVGSLADGTTTVVVTALPFPRTMKTVVSSSGSTQTITITVTPTGGRALSAVTRTITRRITTDVNPFS